MDLKVPSLKEYSLFHVWGTSLDSFLSGLYSLFTQTNEPKGQLTRKQILQISFEPKNERSSFLFRDLLAPR